MSRTDGSQLQQDVDRLKADFLKQRPLYVNLLDDLGTVDCFIIDGDALLLECVASPQFDISHGVQLLHLTYLVEDFIHSLQGCLNAQFSIVFFETHKCIWKDAQQAPMLLARSVLQQHLQSTLKQTVQTFESWLHTDWAKFVAQVQAAFLLMSDIGATSQELFTARQGELVEQLMQACAMHHLSSHCVLPIAYMADIRFQQDVVYGFKATELFRVADVAQCNSAAGHVGDHVCKAMAQTESADTFLPGSAVAPSPQLHWNAMAGVQACVHLLRKAASASVVLPASLDDGNQPMSALNMCWAWCLHQAACDYLPLDQRCVDLESLEQMSVSLSPHAGQTNDTAWLNATADGVAGAVAQHPSPDERANRQHTEACPQLAGFIQQWSVIVNGLLKRATAASEMTDADRARLPDLLDGRLWHFMLSCISLAQPTGLPEPALQSANQLMDSIGTAANIPASSVARVVAPLSAAAGHHSKFVSAPATQWHQNSAAAAATTAGALCTPQGNALVDAFLGGKTQQCTFQQPEVTPAAAEELRVFHDTYHWHTGLPIEPSYIGETHTANLLAQYRGADVHQMAHCPQLAAWQRGRLQSIIKQQADVKLRHFDPKERSKILARAAETAKDWLQNKFERLHQLNARFMTQYGDTMSATKYCMPDLTTHKKERKTTSKQRIIERNTADTKAKSEADRTKQWSALQKELQQYAAVHNDCWDAYMVSCLTAFLDGCKDKTTSADTFLAACCFRLQGELNAWKKDCRCRCSTRIKSTSSSKRSSKRADTMTLPTDFSSSTPSCGVMSHAVGVWMAVQSILGSGLLKHAAAASASKSSIEAAAATNKAVKQALKDCKQAVQMLGFHHTAEAIATLQTSLEVEKPSKCPSNSTAAAAATGKLKKMTACKAPSSPASSAGKASSPVSQDRFSVGMTEAQFQLQFCGDQLQRGTQAAPDLRVSSFTPDPWQRGVMDAIDARESCVICAPTSSGKTFISSFCMDRVLRSSKDGIVVFVAPTKALVNQTAAQVQRSFGAVVGVFTRDYRHNEEAARILVTVPACLEILLFSTTHSHREWVKRLRYVIFDEMHCMREGGIKESGAAETSGAIWEHCLLLIRCPFLALSATIGNPEQVAGWLQDVKSLQQKQDQGKSQKSGTVQPTVSYRVRLIQHSERYADLRYHIYHSTASVQPEDPTRFDQMLHKMHPFAVLDVHQIEGSGFPADLALEPSDCLELFNNMQSALQQLLDTEAGKDSHLQQQQQNNKTDAVQDLHAQQTMVEKEAEQQQQQQSEQQLQSELESETGAAASPVSKASSSSSGILAAEGQGVSPASPGNSQNWATQQQQALALLSPDAHFTKGQPISRPQVRKWEAALKDLLQLWASDSTITAKAATAQVLQSIKSISAWGSARTAATAAQASIDPDEFHTMLRGLEGRGMLPALAFSFDRRKCEYLAGGLAQILQHAEAAKRAEQPIDEHQLRAQARQAEKAAKAGRDRKATRRDAQEAQTETVADYEAHDEDAVDPAFSFAGQRLKSMSQAEVQEWMELGTWAMDHDDPLKQALRRGIGVHHSGLPTKYRQVVEILFRCGYLRVVLATGTLAYGINMPCRTVIFVGDHIFLNALQFRQMSGRAGRRGFDTLGHVIFMHVPQRKCASLLISPVPQLHGNFPLSVTLALRALTLQKEATHDPDITNDLLRLLQRPFFASEDPALGQKMQHLFSYAMVYLQQQVMLNSSGQACEFAGMASHLFWAEPSNYAFVTLLRKGVFHNICQDVKRLQLAGQAGESVPNRVAEQVLLIMSHLFERVRLVRSAKQDAAIQQSPSRVVLEGLSPEVEAIVAEHNAEALDRLLMYVGGYISANADSLPPSNALPMSGLTYPQQHANGDNTELGTVAVTTGALLKYHRRVTIASPFVALSGQGESSASVEQVVQCVRPGVLLNAASVPSVRNTDRQGCPVLLNRYILDFWSHGQKRALSEANGLREGDAWQHLKSFTSILKAIATAMSKMVDGTAAEADPVVWTFSKLAEELHNKHKRFNSAMRQQ